MLWPGTAICGRGAFGAMRRMGREGGGRGARGGTADHESDREGVGSLL
jgi:hypothetical protein